MWDCTGATAAVCLVRGRGETTIYDFLFFFFFACCYAEQPSHPVERSVSEAADAPSVTARYRFPSPFKAAPKGPSEPDGEKPGVNTLQITSMQIEITPEGSQQCYLDVEGHVFNELHIFVLAMTNQSSKLGLKPIIQTSQGFLLCFVEPASPSRV